MNHQALKFLYITQFLSAFADNMALFVIANLLRQNGFSPVALALVSMAFFLPFILMAPVVGPIADKYSKTTILLAGNLLKLLGIVLLMVVDHQSIVALMVSYFTVGIGAVVYSPAKYGILVELTGNEMELFEANSRIEAYTILAILLGIGGGGAIAAITSAGVSSSICLLLFAASIAMTFFIPMQRGNPHIKIGEEIRLFFDNFRLLYRHPATHYALVGTGAFWMSSAVLRIAVLAWIPLTLGFAEDDFRVSLILATTSIGIIGGAFFAPKVIPLSRFTKAILYGFLMTGCIMVFPWIQSTFIAILMLLAVGFMGGVFIVPMNTVIQEQGLQIIGSGKTIAVQNFVENGLMLGGTAIYYAVAYMGGSVSFAILFQGILLAVFLGYLVIKIPEVDRARTKRI
ncbi:lysophospholipid transporter LplT [Brevibacillus laterosporus]|uniref:Lysophospholipid transporter LplT n=1 Tax=Brevibacillus laterosporus TaxID=1465 RepID=A0A502H5X6_BRELA|nr:lysophospholipid transporter LplT [Brevibacillus laterosporus]QDX94895.1 lysophospholipid transporter LplT [Brevibacillus laterosporus]TPG68763.1 lysophospholipid transporter LplT [Brevibacillus laterosporus]TPG90387.1 lysophospholipid transporter LplT [Brevibacillus laterosporus]